MPHRARVPSKPTPEMAQKIVTHADLAIQIFCNQISRDYLKFIKTHVLKDLPEYKGMSLRELKIIMLVDGMPKKVLTGAETAGILRMDAATATRGATELMAKDMLVAKDDPFDNRIKNLSLTDKGYAFVSAYRARCLQAVTYANECLRVDDHDAFLTAAFKTFHQVKDRAAAFAAVNFKARQGFHAGIGQLPHHQTPAQDLLHEHADFVFQIYATQISSDYLAFIRKHLMREMKTYGQMKLRELRVLMCMDFYGQAVTAVDIANVMRFEPATISRALDVLLNAGMVTEKDNYEDGRSKLLSLTETGQAYADQYKTVASGKISAVEAHYNCHWDTQTRAEALAALDNIKDRSARLAALKRPRKRKPLAGNIMRRNFQDNDPLGRASLREA